MLLEKKPSPNKVCRYKNKQIRHQTLKYLLKMFTVLYNTECCRVLIILARRDSLLKLDAKSYGTKPNAPTITGTIEVLFFQYLPI